MKYLSIVLSLLLGTSMLVAGPPDDEPDWGAKIIKKQAEVDALLDILGPVVEEITKAFEEGRTSEIIEEDWADAGAHLGAANEMYADCKKRIKAGEETKVLFLQLENAWQIYVKAGVAGLRTKQMIDALP